VIARGFLFCLCLKVLGAKASVKWASGVIARGVFFCLCLKVLGAKASAKWASGGQEVRSGIEQDSSPGASRLEIRIWRY
jgi:hypothetical protein